MAVKTWVTRPYLVWVLSLSGAVLAAFIVLVIGAIENGHWYLTTFFEDLVKNAFIATIVAVGTQWINEQQKEWRRRREQAFIVARQKDLILLAANGWSPLSIIYPDEQWSSTNIGKETEELEKLADSLESLHEASTETREGRKIVFVMLKSMLIHLAGYTAEGTRARRLLYLHRINEHLEPLETALDPDLAQGVRKFRALATGAQAWIIHTNAVVFERLAVERLAPLLSTSLPSTNFLFDIAGEKQLYSSAATFEPVWLLITHITSIINSVDRRNPDQDWTNVGALMDQVRRCLGSLRNEVRTMAAASKVLAELLSMVPVDPQEATNTIRQAKVNNAGKPIAGP